jgi:hypothetical protein
MTSPGLLESLSSAADGTVTQSRIAAEYESSVVTRTDERMLALFLGVNHHAWVFTSSRLLMLKRAKPLARLLAGRKMISFTGAQHALKLEDVLEQARIRSEILVADIAWIDAERIYSASAVVVFARGRRHELTVGHKRAELSPSVESLRHGLNIPQSAAGYAMKRDLRIWALFCGLTGSLTFLLSFAYPGMLEPVWGLTVAVMGVGVWYSAEPAMFIVLGVSMAWAGLMSLCGLNANLLSRGHLPLSVPFQLYWALTLFAKFQKYEHLYDVESPAGTSSAVPGRSSLGARAADLQFMPSLSLIIGVTEIVLLSLRLTAVWQWPHSAAALISRGHLHLAMIGAAVGLASLYSRRNQHRLAMTGITINAVMALTLITLLMTKWHQP